MGTEPKQVGARAEGGAGKCAAAQKMSVQPGGPRRPTERGSCGGSPSLGTRPGALFWGWGTSAGGGAMTEG